MRKIKVGFNFKSIKTKLLVSLLSICIIPLLILGAVSYFNSKSIIVEKLETSSAQILKEANRGIDKELIAMGNNVTMLANNYNFINIVSNPELSPYLIDSLKGIQETNQNVESIYMGTTSKNYYIYPATDMDSNYDPTSRPWYQEAVENKGKVCV